MTSPERGASDADRAGQPRGDADDRSQPHAADRPRGTFDDRSVSDDRAESDDGVDSDDRSTPDAEADSDAGVGSDDRSAADATATPDAITHRDRAWAVVGTIGLLSIAALGWPAIDAVGAQALLTGCIVGGVVAGELLLRTVGRDVIEPLWRGFIVALTVAIFGLAALRLGGWYAPTPAWWIQVGAATLGVGTVGWALWTHDR